MKMTLIATNKFQVWRHGWSQIRDLNTFLHNVAVVGAIEYGARLGCSFAAGRHVWMPNTSGRAAPLYRAGEHERR
jgi:hypothetical protein